MKRVRSWGMEKGMIPCEAEFFQDTKDPVGRVDLVRKEALVRGVRETVVVVPAFAERDEREKEIVS